MEYQKPTELDDDVYKEVCKIWQQEWKKVEKKYKRKKKPTKQEVKDGKDK